ncbi:hypothetical protein, partial [Corynebacterium liangguodongii]
TLALIASGFLDVDKLTGVISAITPLLIIAVIGALMVTIVNMPSDFGALNELSLQNSSAAGVGNSWFLSALNYAALCILVGVSMILVIAGSELNPGKAGLGGLIGGIVFAIMLVILAFVIFANMEGVFGADLPLLKVFDNMHPAVGVAISLIIYLMIYNTAVGMFYGMARRLSASKPQRFRPIYFTVVLIGFALSFIGFADLLSWVYPVIGYLGMAVIVVMVYAWATHRDEIKEETQRRERLTALAGQALDPGEDDLTSTQRAEVEKLATSSHIDDNELWHTVQEGVAADLDADSECDFELTDAPALDPSSEHYDGAPSPSSGSTIAWEAYDSIYGSESPESPESPEKKG